MNKKGTIFVARNEDDWRRLNLSALIPPVIRAFDTTNIFDMADVSRGELRQHQKIQKELEEKRKKNPKSEIIKESNDKVNPILDDKTRMKPIQYDEHGLKDLEHKDLEKMEEHRVKEFAILHNTRKLFNQHGGDGQNMEYRTEEFKTMSRALDRYMDEYKKLGKALRGEAEENEVIIDTDEKSSLKNSRRIRKKH